MRILGLLCAVSLIGCQPEKADEEDTEETDSDGDGLSDSEEANLGTNPNESDSDGDGYLDGWEVTEGSDPTDASSSIYQGGWPYYPDKSTIGGDWDEAPAEGSTMPNYIAVDQFGDSVNLHDFAGQGKRIVLDVSTEFCGPCKDIASFLSTADQSSLVWNEEGEYYPWWKEEYADLYDMVQNEEIYWITILFSTSDVLTQENSAAWEEEYPNDKIPVLADGELTLYNYLKIESYPAISVLDENMNFLVYSNGGPFAAFAELFPN